MAKNISMVGSNHFPGCNLREMAQVQAGIDVYRLLVSFTIGTPVIGAVTIPFRLPASARYSGLRLSDASGPGRSAMIHLERHGTRLCDGLTRRRWLSAGTLGALGFTLADWFQARAAFGGQVAR